MIEEPVSDGDWQATGQAVAARMLAPTKMSDLAGEIAKAFGPDLT